MTKVNPNADLLRHGVRSFFDWLFRIRTPGIQLIRGGLFLFTILLLGWVFDISIPTENGPLTLSLKTADTVPQTLINLAYFVAVAALVSGFLWELHRYFTDVKNHQRRKVIAVELRGLRDSPGVPVSGAVPKTVNGRREQVLIDIRDHIIDGRVSNPDAAVSKVNLLPALIRSHVAGLDRDDAVIAFGGLAPVPFTFLAGVLLDDEEKVIALDWDRNKSQWRTLDAFDDGLRFSTKQPNINPGSEVALAVSVSYLVDRAGIESSLGILPIVEMTLESGNTDCHWSEVKQQALGQQFLSKLIELANIGVSKIHLFIAAQSSVTFRFGRLYDKRNLPSLRVYQYQRSQVPAFPWSLEMPVAGSNEAKVVQTQ